MSTMESFTPIASSIGGILIGIAAAGLLMFHGRIAGISGIAGGIFRPTQGDTSWRVMFLVGLFAAGFGWSNFFPQDYVVDIDRSTAALVIAGLTVGIGTQVGGGCTSGHGVCGLGRLSKRSTVATISFMITAALTVFVINEVLGGSV
ncbi:MAG: YeeE/YedE family protein [Myxococcales bacterium]|jgi:uncharacterized membrane protein YedE/YeeE|nr:MAG: YeeE/YedE family protein [Myxococcales bacterium]